MIYFKRAFAVVALVALAGCVGNADAKSSASATSASPKELSNAIASYQSIQQRDGTNKDYLLVDASLSNPFQAAMICDPSSFALVTDQSKGPILQFSTCDSRIVAPGTATTVHLYFEPGDAPATKLYWTSGSLQDDAPVTARRN
jgi:hypothetical protein